MRKRIITLSLLTAATPFLAGARGSAQAHPTIPELPIITGISRSCLDETTTMWFRVMRYDPASQEWGASDGRHTVDIQGRGGSIRFLTWNAFESAVTDEHDGGGWFSWKASAPQAFQLRIVLPDGTKSEEFAQPDQCTP